MPLSSFGTPLFSSNLFVWVSGRTHDTLASLCTMYQVSCFDRPNVRQGSRFPSIICTTRTDTITAYDALPSDVRQTQSAFTFWRVQSRD